MTSVGVMASGVNLAAGTDVLLEKFNNLSAWTVTGTPTGIVAGGRTGNAVEFAAFSGASIAYTIPAPNQDATVVLGFGFRASAVSGGEYVIAGLWSDSGATEHNRLSINSAGALIFYRYTSGLQTSAAGIITAATWYYIEMKVKLDDATGTYEVRVNGSPVLGPATGQDTRNAGTKTVFDTIRLVPQGFNSQIVRFDDLYVTMGASAPFKGPTSLP